jgi:peptidoglycan-associated lipoprotein
MEKTMAKPSLKLMSGVALALIVAGCAKKPKELPPPPPTQSAPVEQAPAPGPVGNAIVPGSKEDFLAQAGTDTVHFDTDKSDIDTTASDILAKQAAWLQKYPQLHVTVEGHCDERGTREYNLALGDRRANSAKNFLVEHGVDASRISVISYGKERPVAQGSDEESWAQNRRAVTVLPQ